MPLAARPDPAEDEVIRRLGVEFRCDTRVGVDVGFDELTRDFQAVVIAVGAKNSRTLRLTGVDGPGITAVIPSAFGHLARPGVLPGSGCSP